MKIKPCPFCGNEWPWRIFPNATAQIGCDNEDCAGGTLAPHVGLLFKAGDLPPHLQKYAFPAIGVVIPPAADDPNAEPMGWPKHGLWQLPLPDALMQDERSVWRWNRRDGEGLPEGEFGIGNGH